MWHDILCLLCFMVVHRLPFSNFVRLLCSLGLTPPTSVSFLVLSANLDYGWNSVSERDLFRRLQVLYRHPNSQIYREHIMNKRVLTLKSECLTSLYLRILLCGCNLLQGPPGNSLKTRRLYISFIMNNKNSWVGFGLELCIFLLGKTLGQKEGYSHKFCQGSYFIWSHTLCLCTYCRQVTTKWRWQAHDHASHSFSPTAPQQTQLGKDKPRRKLELPKTEPRSKLITVQQRQPGI